MFGLQATVGVVSRRTDVAPDETRRRLVEAAAAVFTERGFARASLEEISARAGFTRGAFHWHFESKEELLLAVMTDRMRSAIAGKDQVVRAVGSPLGFNKAQRTGSQRRSRDDRRRWALLTMEFWLLAARDTALGKSAAQLKEELREATARQVTELAGDAAASLPLPARTIASGLMALDDGFALQELLDPSITSHVLWDLMDLLTSAVLAPQP